MENLAKETGLIRYSIYTIVICSVMVVLLSISLSLQASHVNWITKSIDFASHHYFLSSFVLLTLFAITFRYLLGIKPTKILKPIDLQTRKLRQQKRIYRLFIRRISYLNKSDKFPIYNTSNSLENNESALHEILIRQAEEQKRKLKDLHLAILLEEKSQREVKIIIKYLWFKRKLKTSVWHVDSKNIMLKGGFVLPIDSVFAVEF